MDTKDLTPLLCVVGPTASGKTGLAISLAGRLNGEVVSCDSMQIYKGMDIGTAKPAPEETRGIPHHMIDCASPFEPWSAGFYARESRRCIEDIRARGRVPIVCGGTGLWLRALTQGLSDMPDCPQREHGPDAYERLRRVDPAAAARLSPGDRQRIGRALDVYDATGVPLSEFHQRKPAPRYRAVCVGWQWEREVLEKRIRARAADMLARGLIAETRALLDVGLAPDCAPLRAIGYRETVAFLQNNEKQTPDALARLTDEIAIGTRQYAKRQRTWFAHQTETVWFDPGGGPEAIINWWHGSFEKGAVSAAD